MADDERRAGVEAAACDAHSERIGRSLTANEVQAVTTGVRVALDRVRDARGDDGLPDCEHGYFAAGGTDTCPACDADALDYLERRKAEAARSPQGEDHEAGLEAMARAIDRTRDIAEDGLAAYLALVSSSRDGTVAVEHPEPDALGGLPPSQPKEDG